MQSIINEPSISLHIQHTRNEVNKVAPEFNSIPSTREYLRQIINRGISACLVINETCSMIENLASNSPVEEKRLYDSVALTKECEDKMRKACQSLAEIDEYLAEIDMTILYDPPPSFD